MGKSLVLKALDKQNNLSEFSLLTFTLVAMPFFVFLLSSLIPAQVIIKEKVEINPQRQLIGDNPSFSFPDTLNGGSGNKSISSNPQYQPDNLQSTFPLPEGGRVTVEILSSEAAENSQINLELRQPNQETLLEYANHNAGFTWVSPDYFANTNFEIGIYWYWENEGTLYQGVEAGAEVSSLGFDEYYIGFEAAGDDWDYNELVVRVKIETYLPLVLIDPPNISTGETAVVTVKKQFYDGRIEDFSAVQLFEFGMMEGCAAGVLISGSDTSNYFNGVTQPVTFLAADSLENDEETVKIGVGVTEQNPLAKMQIKTNTLTQSKNQNIKMKDKNDDTKIDETKINSIIIGSCFGGDFESDKRGNENVIVKGEPFKIDWDHPISHYINTVPEMQKLLTIWLTPKNYEGVYTIDWDLEVKLTKKIENINRIFKYTFHDRMISNDPNGTDLPIPVNDITIIGGDEITLTIKEFFYFDKPNQLRKPITKKIAEMKILGDNPDKEAIKGYVANHEFPHNDVVNRDDQILQMQIIILKESTWNQFYSTGNEKGYPNLQLHPYDWGLTQMSDPQPPFEWIWNWKTNINAGVHHLYSVGYLEAGTVYEQQKRKEGNEDIRYFNHDELLKFTSQRYKGYWYYVEWIPGNPRTGDTGYWRENNVKKWKKYGNDFWDKYGKIKAGNPDPSWGW